MQNSAAPAVGTTIAFQHPPTHMSLLKASIAGVVAAIAYWFAFSTPIGAAGVLIAIPCICLFGKLPTARQAFYGGLLLGMAIYVPHLLFFWRVFGPAGALLWLVAGFPIGVFVLLLRYAHFRLGSTWALWLTPILWTGVEYFRSEVYYLRFAWLLPGQAAAFLPGVRMVALGVYGLGFLYALWAALVLSRNRIARVAGFGALLSFAALMYLPKLPTAAPQSTLYVAGVQLESPAEEDAAYWLERLAVAHPEAQILVMSEYTFLGPVPPVVRNVVRKYHRYLVVGGTRVSGDGSFEDTAFVVGPEGQDIFSQGKSVPVQFMGDGRPAKERHVWNSPWGKIGIAVCYDLSYASVMDDFVREGAQGLIIPTMDLMSWGEYERRMLHDRMAPIRSAEYGIPTFGVWSSGVSQLTDRFGRVVATAEYPGQGQMIAGPFDLRMPGRVPPDRWLAVGATWATGVFVLFLLIWKVKSRQKAVRVPSK